MTTSLPLYYLCKLLNKYRSAKNDKLNGDLWFYNFEEYPNKSIEKQNSQQDWHVEVGEEGRTGAGKHPEIPC